MSLSSEYECMYCLYEFSTHKPATLPCEKCGLVMYCDQKCKDLDWETHQDMETQLCQEFQEAFKKLESIKNREFDENPLEYLNFNDAVFDLGMVAFNEVIEDDGGYQFFEIALEVFKEIEMDGDGPNPWPFAKWDKAEKFRDVMVAVHLTLGKIDNLEEVVKLTKYNEIGQVSHYCFLNFPLDGQVILFVMILVYFWSILV